MFLEFEFYSGRIRKSKGAQCALSPISHHECAGTGTPQTEVDRPHQIASFASETLAEKSSALPAYVTWSLAFTSSAVALIDH
jgi:hypothetical protein